MKQNLGQQFTRLDAENDLDRHWSEPSSIPPHSFDKKIENGADPRALMSGNQDLWSGKVLHHGTSLENARMIMEIGFDNGAEDTHGKTWGPGVYLTESPRIAREFAGPHGVVMDAHVPKHVEKWLARDQELEHYADQADYRNGQQLEDVLKGEGLYGITHAMDESRPHTKDNNETIIFNDNHVRPYGFTGPSFT